MLRMITASATKTMQTIKAHKHRPHVLLAGIVVLVSSPILLYYLSSHAGLPTALLSSIVILLVLKHLGVAALLLGPVYALFRRRSRD